VCAPIPFRDIETIFLDVGNTLVSMDYVWIRDELASAGVSTELDALIRAEAASRPAVSQAVAGERSTEGLSIFELYLKTILNNLGTSPDAIPALVERLVPIFRGPERERLWSYVLPGVPQALERLTSLGRTLAVVSNSDGSVERVLERQGLRPYLTAVFDSHIVGFEKPDPRFFHHALEATGARAEATLHVGDLYSADIVGGRAAGVHTALVDPFDDWLNVDCPRFKDLDALSRTFHADANRKPNRT
jgi:HAD superfamily hydrolase (TIGR01509 family)